MRPEIEARLLEVKAIVKQMRSEKKFDDGALLRSLGGWVEDKSGNRDFAFFQTLPKAGPEPKILLQGLCSLYELSLADGTATISGAFVKSLGSTVGMDLLFSNINDVCHRKGQNGVELTHGQAGCVDPKGPRLEVLAMVKELLYLGLVAAGQNIVAIIASSNASIESFGFKTDAHFEHFLPLEGTGTYEGVHIYGAPHYKYTSTAAIFNSAVAGRLEVRLGDTLAVTSNVLDGYVTVVLDIHSRAFEEMLDGEQYEDAARQIYETIRKDPESRVVVREWARRHSTTTTPEEAAMLEAEYVAQGECGGKAEASA